MHKIKYIRGKRVIVAILRKGYLYIGEKNMIYLLA